MRVVLLQRNALQLACHFSSEQDKKENDKPNTLSPQVKTGLYYGGAALTLYGISTLMWDITSSMMNLTPATMGYYGFLGGAVTSLAITSAFAMGKRSLYISPDVVRSKVTSSVSRSDEVSLLMGGKVTIDNITMLRTSPGNVSFVQFMPAINAPSVEMAIKLHSAKADGVIIAEAEQARFSPRITYLAVHKLSQAKGQAVLIGEKRESENDLVDKCAQLFEKSN